MRGSKGDLETDSCQRASRRATISACFGRFGVIRWGVSSIQRDRPFDLAIAAAADPDYAWPAVLALLSAGIRSTASVVCLLVGDGLLGSFVTASQEAFARFGIRCDHVPVDLREFDGLPLGSHFSRATYGRLRVAEAARPLAPRTLYLDADTLVVGDISPLAALKLGATYVAAAVRARGIPTCSSPGGITDWETSGVEATTPFFNAGVLLIENDAWARQGVTDQVIESLNRAPGSGHLRGSGNFERHSSESLDRVVVALELPNPARSGWPTGPLVLSRRSC